MVIASALLAPALVGTVPAAAATAPGQAPAPATTASGTSSSASSSRLGEDQAMVRARQTGKPVLATAETTSTSTLTANPNGTLTLTQDLAPVRKLVHGQWQNLDATLVRNPDGTLSPKSSTSPLSLSGGDNNAPLATMHSGDGGLALSLPAGFRLGTPTVSGATATYRSVLPGVDLAVTAQDSGGFSEVLVVKDAQAAANPALADLALGTQTSGVTLASDAAGDITGKDAHGRTLFAATAPTMWDSARLAAKTPLANAPATGQSVDAHTGTPVASDTTGPGAGAHHASLRASYRGGRVDLTAATAVLRGKDTVYPVYIDPTFVPTGQTDTVQAWATVDSEWPSTSFYDPAAATPGPLHVGYTNWTSDVSTNRSFFQTSVHSGVWNATVLSSSISFYENWSASCTAEPVDLYQTGSISSGTTWNNQPAWISKLGSDDVANGWSTSCGPGDVTYNIQPTMQAAANGHWSNATFGLRADDESNDLAWKQFSKQATITTTYDHAPITPTALTTSPTTDCTAGSPTVLGLGDVALRAAVSDPDGTISPLTADFTLKNLTSNATYTQAVNATSGTTAEAFYSHTSATGPFQALTARTEFAWYLTVTDQKLASKQSVTCHFSYDPTAPGAPTIAAVTSSTSQCSDLSTDSTDALCTDGTAAGFTITDTDTDTSVPTGYEYQLNGGNPISVPAPTSSPYSASISVKPTEQTNTLTVTAIGVGGNIGETQDFRFIARPPATATSDDMTGDGHADLLTVGGQNGLAPGLWLAAGNGTGQVNTTARNIGIDGNGVSTSQTAASFNGTQAITGHFVTGAGFNDVLDYGYDASTGAVSGEILPGQGDGSTLNPIDATPVTDAASIFTKNTTTTNADGSTTTTTNYATAIANGGGLNNTVNSAPVTGYPDLLLVINGSLYDEPSNVDEGSYPGADTATDLADVNPYCLAQNTANANTDCTTGWTGWTLASTLLNGQPVLFARDTSSNGSDPAAGQLWYLSAGNLYNLAYDSLSNGDADTGLSAIEVAATGWDSTSQPTSQAADINNDGTPDLWTVSGNSNGTVTDTAHLMSLSGTTATLAAQTGQSLTTATHSWPLNDYDTTGATAADTTAGTPLNLTGNSGVTATTGDLFTPDVTLTGSGNGSLSTSVPALTLSGSFTVSAWVKPTVNNVSVLSQDGSGSAANSGMVVSALSSGWQFSLNTTTGGAWTFDNIVGGTVQLGAWAHLTATYNANTQVMDLYVDDVHVATGSHAPVGAVGDFQIGDSDHSGARGGYYTGQIANVQAWNGAAVAPVQPYTPASYHQSVLPVRILDTRSNVAYTDGAVTAGTATVQGGSVVPLRIAGDSVTPATTGAPATIPASVTAVAVDVTATNQNAPGFVTAYADGTQRPITSSTNYTANDTVTGYQIVPVGNDGEIDLYTAGSSANTSALIVDLTGYFTSDPNLTSDQTYTPLATATRALDTRASTADTTGLTAVGTVPANTAFTLQITGDSGVPSTATAVAANLTTAGQTGSGYLEAYATGSDPTAMTSLTYSTADAISSMAADIPLSGTGSITIANRGSAAAVIVDISGYYTTSTTGQTYHAVSPTRLVDTRNGTGGTSAAPVAAWGTYTTDQADTQQVTTATQPTLVTMLTITDDSDAGNVIAYESGTTQPTTSNLNWNAAQTVANLALTPTSTGGQISLYNHSAATIDLVVDCSGYFA
ncbi:LamG-like jellyroll fold domain-containing protein [Streptacidiphilus sp. P02-A3a]|uniref:LamG-like jellyroll fold domain-containing protein n=1 Tax=Streptacidiphilus sp. P02-A3a TaxID=2704468 RepID=UPI0015FAA4FE|nr:LamG-like jellyroll fold domain-containing protein [Streptacidiphilus sp. P02-A3a]QMU71745.1 LamG domain-containing protein [Streptacidiphilus sp. P02-A3a]